MSANSTTNFSHNWGGRLFSESFSDIRDLDDSKFIIGSVHDIFLKGNSIGIAEVVGVRRFFFKDIRDPLSYLITGKPAHYLAGMLNHFYNEGKALPPDHKLMHVVFMWRKRNLEIQQFLLNEWWMELTNTQVA